MKVHIEDEPGDAPGLKQRTLAALVVAQTPDVEPYMQIVHGLTATAARREIASAIHRKEGKLNVRLLNPFEVAMLAGATVHAKGPN